MNHFGKSRFEQPPPQTHVPIISDLVSFFRGRSRSFSAPANTTGGSAPASPNLSPTQTPSSTPPHSPMPKQTHAADRPVAFKL